MIEIYPNLYVGNETDYYNLPKNPRGWRIVQAAKEPFHRDALGYTEGEAPRGHPDYLVARRDHRLILNLTDALDPKDIPKKIIDDALSFIDQSSTQIREFNTKSTMVVCVVRPHRQRQHPKRGCGGDKRDTQKGDSGGGIRTTTRGREEGVASLVWSLRALQLIIVIDGHGFGLLDFSGQPKSPFFKIKTNPAQWFEK